MIYQLKKTCRQCGEPIKKHVKFPSRSPRKGLKLTAEVCKCNPVPFWIAGTTTKNPRAKQSSSPAKQIMMLEDQLERATEPFVKEAIIRKIKEIQNKQIGG
jgi:hypothetical protein